MTQPYTGEIQIFGGQFAPAGWAFCDGQLLAVGQYDALFSLFGTIYGGDGRTTFGLPDLRGRFAMHYGTGNGLSPRREGAKGGEEMVTLVKGQLPVHNHEPFKASSGTGTTLDPVGNSPATTVSGDLYSAEDLDNPVAFATQAVTSVGGSQQHDNMNPFQCVNFIVALYGTYPSRH